ncbi:MAG: hypothetical protein ACOZQL_20240 [Myxococcota bacterium]|nr:hypothetical protein [Myxococcus sp.]
MVQRLVVRLGKRRAAWEKTDPREIADVEFQDRATGGLDLRPSVYVVAAEASEPRAGVIRVRAEHSASWMSPPRPVGTMEFNVDGATRAHLQPSPGETKFQYANSVHAELLLGSVDDLLALIATLLAERDKRAIALTGAEVIGYVEGRQAAGDPEWTSVIGPVGAEQGEWGTAVVNFRKKRNAAGS